MLNFPQTRSKFYNNKKYTDYVIHTQKIYFYHRQIRKIVKFWNSARFERPMVRALICIESVWIGIYYTIILIPHTVSSLHTYTRDPIHTYNNNNKIVCTQAHNNVCSCSERIVRDDFHCSKSFMRAKSAHLYRNESENSANQMQIFPRKNTERSSLNIIVNENYKIFE